MSIKFLALAFLIVMPYFSMASRVQEPDYEEISVYINVQGLGGTEVDAVIKGKEAYISITGLFDFLKVKNVPAEDQQSVSGFFLRPQDEYLIDKTNNHIKLGAANFDLAKDDLIQTGTGLYLHTKLFTEVFSLTCVFDFSTLSVSLSTQVNLPVLQEKRQELMRKNMSNFNNEAVADTTVKRRNKGFNFGTADWAVSATQTGQITNTTASLQLGGVVAGGETTLGLYYQQNGGFNLRQQYYLWHYVDNSKPLLRQISAGKIPVQPLSSLLGGVIGVQLSNASTMFRKSQGSYTLASVTKPDWVVELYINSILVNYVKADASGFYSFQVPVTYGTSIVKLRFIGPWGEEQTQEQQVITPYNFLPKGEVEYTVSNGMVDDGRQSRFSRTDIKYGLYRNTTIGVGLEYLSKIDHNPFMPFINASYRPAANLILSGEHAFNVRTKAIANYRLPNELFIEANYTRYNPGQQAILNSTLEERKLMISKQFRTKSSTLYTRLSVNRLLYPAVKQTLTDLLLSWMWHGVSTNLSTYALLMDHQTDPIIYSNLSLSFRLPLNSTLRPQVQYTYQTQQLNSYRIELEKQLFGNGFLNMAFDNNLLYKTQSLTLGLRLDLSFVRTAFSASVSNHRISSTQSVSGGAIYDKKAKYLKFNNRINVGRAGLIIYPFLDINGNNKRDKNEPKLSGLQMKINGGRTENSVQDTTTRVLDLEPFTSYLLELNPSSFDNIAWQMKNISYKIVTDPNQLKVVEIPVQVYGEVSGKVFLQQTGSAGLERIRVSIYKNGTTLVKSILTESDGYFDFLGLPPGSYTIRLDEVQLKKLQVKTASASASQKFTIKPSMDGDVIRNINFELTK